MALIAFSQAQNWAGHSIRNGRDSTACDLEPVFPFNSTGTRTCSTWTISTRQGSSRPAMPSRLVGLPRHPHLPTNRLDYLSPLLLKISIEPKAHSVGPTIWANRHWRSNMGDVHCSFHHGSSRFEVPLLYSISWPVEASSAFWGPSIPRFSGKFWRRFWTT